MGNITMSKNETKQLAVFERLINGDITQVEAARQLGLTTRWVREKVKRYKMEGAAGVMHKSRGRPSKRRWDQDKEALALKLLQTDWHDFAPTFAAEKLEKFFGIKVSTETLRKSMIRAGFWTAKSKRLKHRRRRERRAMRGMLVQFDGSPHDWFEGRGPSCTLLVIIDDATSELLWLEFAPSESTKSTMLACRHYIEKWGIPIEIYVDHGGSFHVNLNNRDGEKKTEWERAMEEMGIRVTHAHSPQAKGRVERANGTLQDRLVKELRLAGISSIEEANRFLREGPFIVNHNANLAKPAAQPGDAHRPLAGECLETIFCSRETRTLMNDFTIQFEKRIFQLCSEQKASVRPTEEITVSTHLDDSITLSIRGIRLSYQELNQRPKKPPVEKICIERKPAKPCEKSRRFVAGLLPIHRLRYDYSTQKGE